MNAVAKTPGPGGGLKLVLIGDGESPHLLKWARALSQRPYVDSTRIGV